MTPYTTTTRRAVLASLGGAGLAGVVSANPDRSVNIQFEDCGNLRVTGSAQLDDLNYQARVSWTEPGVGVHGWFDGPIPRLPWRYDVWEDDLKPYIEDGCSAVLVQGVRNLLQ